MWLGSNFSILPITIASLGIILTVITIVILVRNRDTPLVRASGDRDTDLDWLVAFVCQIIPL